MYSQCPQCQAIFGVSDAHVSAHHGLVRCGHCRAIFHAVTNEVAPPGAPSGDKAPVQRDIEEAAADHRPRTPVESGVQKPPQPDLPAEPEWTPEDFETPPSAAGPGIADAGSGSYGETDPVTRSEADEVSEAILAEEAYGEQAGPEHRSADDDTGEALPPPGSRKTAEQRAREMMEFEGEVEEILIEAPPVLWNAFDEDFDDKSTTERRRAQSSQPAEPEPEDEEEAGAERRGGGAAWLGKRPTERAGSASPRQSVEKSTRSEEDRSRAPLKSPYRARDIHMVELPQPRPFKTMSLSLLSVLLVLVLLWQVKAFYLDDLAQVPVFRPYLERLCEPLGCVLPPRSNFARIDLVGTSISLNPEVPGALEIKASLVNRAHYPQPYPLLRVTLTDREGRVVGRRTYLPSEYRDGDQGLLPTKEIRDVSINLAKPAENAVGYEVELVAPGSENS